jgi:hypothetical protein
MPQVNLRPETYMGPLCLPHCPRSAALRTHSGRAYTAARGGGAAAAAAAPPRARGPALRLYTAVRARTYGRLRSSTEYRDAIRLRVAYMYIHP